MPLELIIHLVIIVVAMIILDQASHLTITNAVRVSDITHLEKAAVGFSILAFSSDNLRRHSDTATIQLN